ncbi:MAG TPA: metallophosphoesterase [Thermoanaerobaculia bacterium]|nr:metallophosphoesterase [Thermoanaerobaculia bacterium]
MRTVLTLLLFASSVQAQTWKFAVSGDSRNCGDIVMPAIAAGVKADGAAFYWHLGDFRALYKFDEDMQAASKTPLLISAYESAAWPDFLRNQIAPFAPLPVYLGIGNHETIGRTRGDFVTQFGDWLTRSDIQAQRLADDPNDHTVRPYYHWVQGGVDFINLDNASPDQFDVAQLAWIKRVLDRDAANPSVKTVVLGMHEALPHSLGCDHSMNESAQGEYSGDQVYRELLHLRDTANKKVYVIASHSHYLLRDVYDSPYWRARGGVLAGLIVGTAGAVRYRLPDTAQGFPPERARTDTYGYILCTVAQDGTITFDFREIPRSAIPPDIASRYGEAGLDFCFNENKDLSERSSLPCTVADAPPGPARRP